MPPRLQSLRHWCETAMATNIDKTAQPRVGAASHYDRSAGRLADYTITWFSSHNAGAKELPLALENRSHLEIEDVATPIPISRDRPTILEPAAGSFEVHVVRRVDDSQCAPPDSHVCYGFADDHRGSMSLHAIESKIGYREQDCMGPSSFDGRRNTGSMAPEFVLEEVFSWNIRC